MLKVVIDTNVFISAFYLPESRPAKVVLLARRKTILNLISPQILKEVERIIKKKLLWDNSKTQSAVRRIKNFSEEVHPQERLAIIADDPDNRILECAVAGQADFIISGDHHLLDLENYQGIKIVNPARFLEAIEAG
jgi:putative PIN family toxin of toxin-antitoxin system